MSLHDLLRSRFRSVLLAVGLLAVAGVVVSLAPAPEAHAESGRRICRYVWDQGVGNPDGRLVSFVVDYKKDGACPAVDPHKVTIPRGVGSWMPPPDTWEQVPVPKMTCEELQILLKLPSEGQGGDPCTYMKDDVLYAVTSHLSSDTATTKRFWWMASIWDVGP